MRAGKACVVKGKWGKERGKTKRRWLSDGCGDVEYAMEKASGSCIVGRAGAKGKNRPKKPTRVSTLALPAKGFALCTPDFK
jgi:hypothetical protein